MSVMPYYSLGSADRKRLHSYQSWQDMPPMLTVPVPPAVPHSQVPRSEQPRSLLPCRDSIPVSLPVRV